MNPETPTPNGPRRPRLDSIDAIRGLVMVIMALDHIRDYFSNFEGDPVDLAATTPGLFFTRWITHFCAPVFVFLAGIGAYLYGQRAGNLGQLSRFLWTRGLWLIVLELTLVRWGWTFQLSYAFVEGQVIWALGASMICLAGLVFLPIRWIAALGVLMIVGHNALDTIQFPREDWRFGLWSVLHAGTPFPVTSSLSIMPLYPLIPWIGVMAAGYAFGTSVTRPAEERRRLFLRLGVGMLGAFVLLRFINVYGDSRTWSVQSTPLGSLLSFLNCSKYPPSLLYLLMTLGPALLLLALADAWNEKLPRFLVVFGRVPMFYYLVHLYLVHVAAAGLCALSGRPSHAIWILKGPFWEARPEGYGYPLWVVYLVWVTLVAALYPLCRWYAGVKQRSRNPLLSYL